jgi:hypothetical protein
LRFIDVPPDVLSVAFETNGKGHIGFIAELPGAFLRGRSEREALSKLDREVDCYLRWLGMTNGAVKGRRSTVVERHASKLTVEDADCEILLEADKQTIGREELNRLCGLALHSGHSFLELYSGAKMKDWVDATRIRKSFHGDNPKTVREVFEHVDQTQHYYFSRLPISSVDRTDLMDVRRSGLREIQKLAAMSGHDSVVYEIDNEAWTVRKVLRRLVWHDRIHGRAITRILRKQKRLGLITNYVDPFFFDTYLDSL